MIFFWVSPFEFFDRCEWAQKSRNDAFGEGDEASHASWGAVPDHLAQDEAEVESGGVDEQSFENVWVAAQVGASHAAGIVEVGEAAFDEFAAFAH